MEGDSPTRLVPRRDTHVLTSEEIKASKARGPHPSPYSPRAATHTHGAAECGQRQGGKGLHPPHTPPEEAHQVIGGGLLEGRDCPWAESYAMFALPFLCKGLISARGVATLSISILRGTQTIALKKDFILETPTTRPASRAAAVLGLPPYRRSNANSSVSRTCSRC